jgi:fermentation-respiration switch protein FrsA (DUF1100 family)
MKIKGQRMSSMLISILIVFVITYSVLGWSLFFMQPAFLYNPVKEIAYTPAELELDFENVRLKTSDGLRLGAWFIPAENSRFTVLFCHGNGGNIMHRLDSLNLINKLGLSCLIFDYRGYGSSDGRPSEEGTYLDAMAAYKWLTEHKKIPSSEIILFGRSLGGSIAAQLATKVDAAALVLESAFTSYVDMGRKFYPYMPVRLFARFRYRTIDYIKDIHRPVLFIHSRGDEIVPFEFGLELYEAANGPKEFVEIFGGHNDGFLLSNDLYIKAWKNWIDSLTQNQKKADSHTAS